ncbi:hypothetical protein [Actinoplanes sp. NPDC051494]|uniref:hypothetical protein n=1 Tax=Actinoplanes sp. NPDC051494 TaxID=3363907 RepID=UPI0037A4C9EB
MQSLPKTEAIAQVNALAETVRQAATTDAFKTSKAATDACENAAGELLDEAEAYRIVGTFQLLVPVAEQPQALAKVRERLEADGLTITDTRTYPKGGGLLSASRGDGYGLTFDSAEPPAMALLVVSPCYRPS